MNCFIDLHYEKIFILCEEKRMKNKALYILDEKLLRYDAREVYCKNSEKKNVYISELLYSFFDCR